MHFIATAPNSANLLNAQLLEDEDDDDETFDIATDSDASQPSPARAQAVAEKIVERIVEVPVEVHVERSNRAAASFPIAAKATPRRLPSADIRFTSAQVNMKTALHWRDCSLTCTKKARPSAR